MLDAKTLWAKWKIVAEKIGNFQFSVIFSIFYIVLVTPFGIISSLFNDFLSVQGRPKWFSKKLGPSTLKELAKQS